jgi:fluoroquinolone transport system permease protein
MRLRTEQAGLLAAPEARTIRWRALLAVAPVSFLVVYAGMHDPGPSSHVRMPLAGLALALWAGFLFDDVAADTVRQVPTPLLLRRAIRIAMALPVLALAWVGLVWYGSSWEIAGTLTAGFVAQIAVALSLSAVGVTVIDVDRGGLFAAAGVFVVFIAAPLLMRGGILTPDPAERTWTWLYGRWIATSAVAIGVLLLASRDPAKRGVRALVRSAKAAGP